MTRPSKEWGMVQELVRPAKLPKGAAPDSAFAFLDGKFVPIREAKIPVMTHGFNYGTGVFEVVEADADDRAGLVRDRPDVRVLAVP
ncbi:MAG: hypothetical protein ACRDF9_14685, partial [Candidatus Limnocylindria bacterium]